MISLFLRVMGTHFLLIKKDSLYGCTTVYPFHLLKDILVVSGFSNYNYYEGLP